MTIDRLSSTAGLLAALRAEVTQKTERRPTATAGRTSAGAAAGRGQHDRRLLRQELTQIVQSTPSRDEAALRGIRRRMVKAMLLWEFGSDLREHPEWQPMLETITQTLESNDSYQQAFGDLISTLA